MDNLQRLKARILADAQAKAAEIKGEAAQKVEEILRRAQSEARDEAAAVLAKGRAEAEETRRRIVTNAQLEARRAILHAKGQVLSETFAAALSALEGLDETTYRKMLVEHLTVAGAAGGGEVILNSRDRERLGPGLVDEVNRRLAVQGKEWKLRLAAEIRPLKGGFVLRTESLEIDNSLESLCRQTRDTFEPEVSRLLFQNSKTGAPE